MTFTVHLFADTPVTCTRCQDTGSVHGTGWHYDNPTGEPGHLVAVPMDDVTDCTAPGCTAAADRDAARFGAPPQEVDTW